MIPFYLYFLIFCDCLNKYQLKYMHYNVIFFISHNYTNPAWAPTVSFASLDYTLQIFICSVIPDRYTGNVNNIEPLTVIKYKTFSKQACVPTNSQNIGYQRNNSWIYKKSQHLFFYSHLPHLKGTPDLVACILFQTNKFRCIYCLYMYLTCLELLS